MPILGQPVCPKCEKATAITKMGENSESETYRCNDCRIKWVDNDSTGQLFVFSYTDEEWRVQFGSPNTALPTEEPRKPQAAPNRKELRTPPAAPLRAFPPDLTSPARQEPPRGQPPIPRPAVPPNLAARSVQQQAKHEADARITQKEQSTAIRKFCEDRKISALFHFTRVANLSAILSRGLLTRFALERLPIKERPIFNDTERYDQQKDTVSVSIGYPNYLMFYAHRRRTAEPWVVLVLEPRILWELDCVFCSTNAANVAVSGTPLALRMSADALFAMFGDLPGIRREELRIPAYFSTDPQAEVLVKGGIERHYIESVWFETRDQLSAWQGNKPNTTGITIGAGDGWFNRRIDHRHWQRDNRDGHESAARGAYFDDRIPF